MPRKTKYCEEDIISAAYSVARDYGLEELSTRSVAKKLNCSTMPVYSFLKSKKNLEEKVIRMAYNELYAYQITPRTGDIFLDMGVGYVLFARNEKFLFRCIHNELHVDNFREYNEKHFDLLLKKLSEYSLLQGMPTEQIRKFFMQGWTYSHGLATLVNIDYFPGISEQEICERLMYTGERYIKGFMAIGSSSEETNS
jgi:AcrR family transcriptional regulator